MKWGALPLGPMGTSLKWAPAITGESTSVSKETASKTVRRPEEEVIGRAVPSFQPEGKVRLAL